MQLTPKKYNFLENMKNSNCTHIFQISRKKVLKKRKYVISPMEVKYKEWQPALYV